MAVLRNGTNQVYLKTLHLFGRNAAKADTILTNGDASQIHAAIAWSGQAWDITDFSRNGTFVDEQRLPPNVKTPLRSGQTIRYALEGALWQVLDLAAPCPILVPAGAAGRAIVIGPFQLLPDEERPDASIRYAASGRWLFDDQHGTRILNDGDAIHVGEHTWRLSLPAPPGAVTDVSERAARAAAVPTFDFLVSQNEEHIRLLLACGDEQIDLGERAHHYSLLTLARRRFADHQRGLDALSQGWVGVEQLSKMLGIEPSHLNIQLFRARSQILGRQGLHDPLPDVIERRRGEVRLSAYPFKITRGLQMEAHFDVGGAAFAGPHGAGQNAC